MVVSSGGPSLVVVLCIGAFCFLVGGIITIASLKDLKRRRRILSMPTSPIARAPDNALVEIKGRIRPSEQGLVEAPFSRRHVVWCRVTVMEYRSSGKSGHWRKIVEEVDARPFMVDDGSGQLARVMPLGATVILDKQRVATSGTLNDASYHLEAFLQARGLKSTSWIGFNKQMRYEEEVLASDDPIFALGPSRRDPGPPVHDGYRMVPSTQLVMFTGAGDAGELILTNKTEAELTSKLLTGFVIGVVVGGVGLVFGLVGLIGLVSAL